MVRLTKDEIETVRAYLNSVTIIPEEEFSEVINFIKKKKYNKDTFLLKENEIETKMALVIQGVVHQYKILDSREVTRNIAIPGMTFCSYISYMDGSPSEQIHKAIQDVTILYFEKEDLYRLQKSCPTFCYISYRKFELYHYEREIRANMIQNKSVQKRFEEFMLKELKSELYLKLLSQKMIASYLNMTPEAYSKAKSQYFKEN